MMRSQTDLDALRVAVPYIRAYKGQVFTVKLGGQLCAPGSTLDHLAGELAVLHQLGIKLVIVHGGGQQATGLSERLGIQPDVFAGRRITDDGTLEVVKMALAGTVNTDLLGAFRKVQVPTIGLSGVDAGLVTARRRPPQRLRDPTNNQTRDIDFGHVGDVVSVKAEPLRYLLGGGFVPVLSSLAANPAGELLNVNADTVAARIAVEIGAAKYFQVTQVDGVLCDPEDRATLESYLSLEKLDGLIQQGAIGGGMLPKLAAARTALEGGVPRVHIINGTVPGTLLAEVFTNEGSGTLLVKGDDVSQSEGERVSA